MFILLSGAFPFNGTGEKIYDVISTGKYTVRLLKHLIDGSAISIIFASNFCCEISKRVWFCTENRLCLGFF